MVLVGNENLLQYRRVSQPEIAKKSINPLFWRSRSFKVIEFSANREPV